MDWHSLSAASAYRHDQQIILALHYLLEFPTKFFQGGTIKTTTKNTVLQAFTAAFQFLSHPSKPFRIADVIGN